MINYKDLKGNDVQLSFHEDVFTIPVKHVLILVKRNNKWLLTHHPTRGIEFPGGKIEKHETAREAAIRETYEETGVRINNLQRIASYVVFDTSPFHKEVFRAEVETIENKPKSSETIGVHWLTDEQFEREEQLSFHMKDIGMKKLREWVNRYDTK